MARCQKLGGWSLRIVEGLRQEKVEIRKRRAGVSRGWDERPGRAQYELHQARPEAEYAVVHNSGNYAMNPGIRAAPVGATDELESRV